MAIESISGNTINSVTPVKSGAKDAVNVKHKTSEPISTDTVDLTDTAQDIKTAVATGGTSPVINEDRVAALRSALQSGSYKVDVERVAEKMLRFEDQLTNST
jgi:negative regulator of flagellin synthesis FlgM